MPAPYLHDYPRSAGDHFIVDIELAGDEVSDQLVFVLKDESSLTW